MSSYVSRSETYELSPKGSFVLAASGAYEYLGFARPSPGRFGIDDATGVVAFTGRRRP